MQTLERLRLLLIPDWGNGSETVIARAEAWLSVASTGTIAVDLRAKQWPGRRLLEVGGTLAELARRHEQILCVSERLDVAELLGAGLLHLGEHGVDPQRARRIQGSRPIVRACHVPECAGEIDAEYVLLSPIVAARKGNPALGLRGLERAREAIERRRRTTRLVALGGVSIDTAGACLAAGASAVAIMGAFVSESPRLMLSALGILR